MLALIEPAFLMINIRKIITFLLALIISMHQEEDKPNQKQTTGITLIEHKTTLITKDQHKFSRPHNEHQFKTVLSAK